MQSIYQPTRFTGDMFQPQQRTLNCYASVAPSGGSCDVGTSCQYEVIVVCRGKEVAITAGDFTLTVSVINFVSDRF